MKGFHFSIYYYIKCYRTVFNDTSCLPNCVTNTKDSSDTTDHNQQNWQHHYWRRVLSMLERLLIVRMFHLHKVFDSYSFFDDREASTVLRRIPSLVNTKAFRPRRSDFRGHQYIDMWSWVPYTSSVSFVTVESLRSRQRSSAAPEHRIWMGHLWRVYAGKTRPGKSP